ncbi:hypothetical protein [Salinicoccus carnicancri]|uniref:hypothetical protein n=1 Tax=Salinicoccus carnicancri TaxID=558170 RepID=UPI00031582FC|nr:hypothetical protein [Salinicoccus carnicancri]
MNKHVEEFKTDMRIKLNDAKETLKDRSKQREHYERLEKESQEEIKIIEESLLVIDTGEDYLA